jgi:APA family basic amino acid/polyamine antiporter
MKPASMAALLGSAPMLIAVWMAAGVLTLFGALLFAEAGAMFPKAGGFYVYLQKMFGDGMAFLFGWSAFAVINTSAVAAIAFICARYAGYFITFPQVSESLQQSVHVHIPFLGTFYLLQRLGEKMFAIVIVLLLAWVNAMSLKAGGRLQLVTAILKVSAIGLLVFGIFFSGNSSVENLLSTTPQRPMGWAALTAGMVALTGAFMAYDGWQCIMYMAGDVRNPQKILPKSIMLAVPSIIIIYVAVNVAYASALPIAVMAQSSLVASDAASAMMGASAGGFIAALIVLSTFGSVNGNLMSTARVTETMAADGLFFAAPGRLRPGSGTPANALLWHAVWISMFILSGSFDMLADMFTFSTWVFIIICAIGMIRLRITMPHHPRPYKMWGYPYTLIAFLAFALYYVVNTLVYEIMAYRAGNLPILTSLLGVALTLAGLPIYWFFNRKRSTKSKTV